MADIEIRRTHGMGRAAARAAADRMAEHLGRKFGLKGDWDGDVLRFQRPGGALRTPGAGGVPAAPERAPCRPGSARAPPSRYPGPPPGPGPPPAGSLRASRWSSSSESASSSIAIAAVSTALAGSNRVMT